MVNPAKHGVLSGIYAGYFDCFEWLCGSVPDLQSGGYRFESRPGLLCTKVYSAFHPLSVGK